MSVLDELREQMENLHHNHSGDLSNECPFDVAVEHCQALIDAFEAAHPGLVDMTWICPRCKQPRGGDRVYSWPAEWRGLSASAPLPVQPVCRACAEENS